MLDNNPIQEIYAVISDDFERVDKNIIASLNSGVSMVEQIGHYIIQAGGKRLRPLLVLLAAKACGYQGCAQTQLATVIEFLHTATLLHDDVVDKSELRRGRSTANQKWGNAPSVLVGDFLYARAFQLMVQLESLKIMDILSEATAVISEGEVMQLLNIRNLKVTEDDYLETIRCKTAMLFEASAHSASYLCGENEKRSQALKLYGYNLGMAFQLTDDILDYQGDSAKMGKNIGDDLAEGKPTLPLIYAMKNAPKTDSEIVQKALLKGNVSAIGSVKEIVLSSGALQYCKNLAVEYSEKAVDALSLLDPSPYKQAMIKLAKFSASRYY